MAAKNSSKTSTFEVVWHFQRNFTANLLLNQPVKEFWKSAKIRRSYRCEFCGLLFLEHSVHV